MSRDEPNYSFLFSIADVIFIRSHLILIGQLNKWRRQLFKWRGHSTEWPEQTTE